MAGCRLALLPLETQTQIRSSVQISSLSDVILELVKNSLDAQAEKIFVRFDFSRGFCSVIDDGDGILEKDFLEGRLAQLYYTSRIAGSQNCYARYGRTLAALSSLSILSIRSSHKTETSTHTAVFKDGKRMTLGEESQIQILADPGHSTSVTVRSLFGGVPVRHKHNASRFESQTEVDKEFFTLRQSLIGIVLAASRYFTIELSGMSHRYVHRPNTAFSKASSIAGLDLSYIVSTIFQAGLINSPDTASWRCVTSRSSTITLQAVISLQAASVKTVQFISLNHQSLPSVTTKMLSDPINALFDASSFGVNIPSHGNAVTSDKHGMDRGFFGGSKCSSRWPMFYVRIDCLEDAHFDEPFFANPDHTFTLISSMLHTLMTEFLNSCGFRSGKKKTTKPVQQFRPTHNLAETSRFNYWSRIKCGIAIPTDVLTGLPFMHRENQTVAPSSSTHFDAGVEEISLHWPNPRTGNVVHVNPRTGMALPPSSVGERQRLRRRSRKLEDIICGLKDYVQSTRSEKPLASIALNHEIPSLGFETRQIPTLEGGKPSRSSGPSPTESTFLAVGKHDLQAASVIGQVDSKFILAALGLDDARRTLILIDQHAADERIKLEKLLQQLCDEEPVVLSAPISFAVEQQEMWRLRSLRTYFAAWNIHYEILPNEIRVSILPDPIAERCRIEPRLLASLIREEIWRERGSFQDHAGVHWFNKIAACPQGVLDILASRACRSAIMFNDVLSTAEAREIIQQLCRCSLPFQCAHGRPSLTTLAQIHTVNHEDIVSSFGQGWQAWTD